MTKLVGKITLIFLLLSIFPSAVYACSCEAPNQRKAFRKARAIFIGQVLEIKESKNFKVADSLGLVKVYDIKFKVDKSWKGVKTSEITVISDNGVLVCSGYNFNVGEKYLIYANENDLIVISNCERSLPLTAASEDIPKLDNFFYRLAVRLLPI